MKKTTFLLTLCIFAFFSAGYAQLPSFMYQSQADNFGGVPVNPADLALCVGDFTLEVSGTASQEINVANGWFTYTLPPPVPFGLFPRII